MISSRRLVNLEIFGIIVVAASGLLITSGSSQNAMATPDPADVDVEELAEAEAGNATMTTAENETADGNMTGTNSTG